MESQQQIGSSPSPKQVASQILKQQRRAQMTYKYLEHELKPKPIPAKDLENSISNKYLDII
jgi:hypothetical protein